MCYQIEYLVENDDCDYKLNVLLSQFKTYPSEKEKSVKIHFFTTPFMKQIFQWANQGDVFAQYYLGSCYANGDGVEKDMLEAIEWYRKAADQGDADAQYNIGLCYANGDGLEEDMTMAMEWYRKAAKRGNAEAQRAIEEWNEYNNFWDYNEEEKRLRKVMKQGNADAQYNLGMCYEKGDGVKENIKKAMDLYQSSAIQGYSKAQCRLGFFYKYYWCVNF